MLPIIVVFLTAVSVANCQTSPPPPKTNIDVLANAIRNGLTKSPVLRRALPFVVQGGLKPHNVYFRVGTRLLARAKMVNPALAEVAATAVQKVGKVTSELYFRTVGYEMAKYLDSFGLLDNDANVKYFAFMIVKSIELQACINGVHNAESVSNAVVYGLYDVVKNLGLITPEDISKLFLYFSYEILVQAGKSELVDFLADVKFPL